MGEILESGGAGAWVLVALVVGAVSFALMRLVERQGKWLPGSALRDPSPQTDPTERARKVQPEPVALIGGLALLVGLALIGTSASQASCLSLGLTWPGATAAWSALLLAFAVGLLDDLLPRGLSPAQKFAGQCLAGLPLGFGLWSAQAESSVGATPSLALVLLLSALAAAVAQNALNTFDNADGVATGIAALGLLFAAPLASAVLLGFLPLNLRRSRASEHASAPRAYLGDSGSHLLGLWLLLTPLAWPLFALPLLDLARLSVERLQRGSRPWRGDRFHLAHLFQARGWSKLAVLGVLALIAAPSIALGEFGLRLGRADLVIAGVAGTALLYLAGLVAVRGGTARLRKLVSSELPAASETQPLR